MKKSLVKCQSKIILLMAITIDGKIARDKNHFADWTSKEDKLNFYNLTKNNYVVFGHNTFKMFKNKLKDRTIIVLGNYDFNEVVDGVYYFNSVEKIIDFVNKRKAKKVFICGGANTNTLFLKNIQEIYLTIEPKLFCCGINLFNNTYIDDKLYKNIELKKIKKLNKNSIFLNYVLK